MTSDPCSVCLTKRSGAEKDFNLGGTGDQRSTLGLFCQTQETVCPDDLPGRDTSFSFWGADCGAGSLTVRVSTLPGRKEGRQTDLHTAVFSFRKEERKERKKGRKEGRKEHSPSYSCLLLQEGRKERRKKGRQSFIQLPSPSGRKDGKKEGRKERRKERRKKGRQSFIQLPSPSGRKEGKKEGRKERRKEGRQEGRKEDGPSYSCLPALVSMQQRPCTPQAHS